MRVDQLTLKKRKTSLNIPKCDAEWARPRQAAENPGTANARMPASVDKTPVFQSPPRS